MKIRQGVTGGVVVALFASLSVGNATESFWVGFLVTLTFSLLIVAGITALMMRANRRRVTP